MDVFANCFILSSLVLISVRLSVLGKTWAGAARLSSNLVTYFLMRRKPLWTTCSVVLIDVIVLIMTLPFSVFSSRLAIRIFVSVSFASIAVPLMVSAYAWSSSRSSASSINFSHFEIALAAFLIWFLSANTSTACSCTLILSSETVIALR